jgi:hypothetical protein
MSGRASIAPHGSVRFTVLPVSCTSSRTRRLACRPRQAGPDPAGLADEVLAEGRTHSRLIGGEHLPAEDGAGGAARRPGVGAGAAGALDPLEPNSAEQTGTRLSGPGTSLIVLSQDMGDSSASAESCRRRRGCAQIRRWRALLASGGTAFYRRLPADLGYEPIADSVALAMESARPGAGRCTCHRPGGRSRRRLAPATRVMWRCSARAHRVHLAIDKAR